MQFLADNILFSADSTDWSGLYHGHLMAIYSEELASKMQINSGTGTTRKTRRSNENGKNCDNIRNFGKLTKKSE